jgi:DNA polymerase beta
MATMDYKQTIIDALDIMRKRDLAEKEPFKARAYATVITQLKQHQEPITCMEDVAKMKGVGEKIQKKIKEIMETGRLASAEKAKEVYHIGALDALQRVYGIGPTKAKSLIQQGIRTIVELRAAVEQQPTLLHEKQMIGLKYYEELLVRIPREEMKEHQDILHHYVPDAELVGSFRRGASHSGDIDALIRVPHGVDVRAARDQLHAIVQQLIDANYIIEILALGDHKCMAICRVDESGTARRLDLLMTPENEYACALLYFTGSDQFNVAFRQHALSCGYTLNEHQLRPLQGTPPPPMKTERDIFAFLRLRYILPEERFGAEQIIHLRPQIAKHNNKDNLDRGK